MDAKEWKILFGIVMVMILVMSYCHGDKQAESATATPSLPQPIPPTELPLAQSGKIGPKEIEQMAEGAMWLDRFADSAKLINVIREDYPKSHEWKTLRNIRHLLHPESGGEPFAEKDARELRSALESMKTIRAKYPYQPPEKQRALVGIFGSAFFESKRGDADAALDSLKNLKKATDAAARGE